MSSKRKRYACWKCGLPMRKKALACKRCRKTQPAAVKTQLATLNKALGGNLRPAAAAPVVKAARPRCPNPACGAKGQRGRNCCARCGTAFTGGRAIAASKAAQAWQQQAPGSAEALEARAARCWNPEDREALRAEAAALRKAAGTDSMHAAGLLMQAGGARSLAEAFRQQHDPRAQAIIADVLGGRRTR